MRLAARSRTSAVIVAFALALASIGLTAPAAHAASALNVTRFDDPALTGCAVDSGTSLRSALCTANSAGGAWDITLPAGDYQLTQGALEVGTQRGATISLLGAEAASTTLHGSGTEQVLSLDPGMLGNVTVRLYDLTITGGVDNVYGGGAIIGGSGNSAEADTLELRRTTIRGNTANTAAGASPANPGGGIQFIGGSLLVVDSLIENNSAGDAAGGGIVYQGMGVASGEQLLVENTVFTGNTVSAAGGENGGAAIEVTDLSDAATMTIRNSRFEGNTVTGPSGPGGAYGAAVRVRGGTLTISDSTFTGNSLPSGGPAMGSAIDVAGGANVTVLESTFTGNLNGTGTIHASTGATLSAHYNRLVGNTGGPAISADAGATADAERNWWGCPGGPGVAGCATASGVDANPWLTLTAAANPADIVEPDSQTQVTASLLSDSAGGAVAAEDLTAFDGLPVQWSAALPAAASVSPAYVGDLGWHRREHLHHERGESAQVR